MSTDEEHAHDGAPTHAQQEATVRRWGRLTLVYITVLVVAASVIFWRLQTDAKDNARQTDQLEQLFGNFEQVQADLLDAAHQQTSLDCQQTAGRNEGIKASWRAFLDTFATPEQQQRPDVVKFLADLEARFPVLTCPTIADTPIVVPVPAPGQTSLPTSTSVP